MALPKTNWKALSEDAKLILFNFYMDIVLNNGNPCRTCVQYEQDWLKIGHIDCGSVCGTLFPNFDSRKHYHPCNKYGPDAFTALKKAIMEWIGE